ncbi:hypothetical protein GCM10017559_49380 [Streptosporangium longisporum]|uniref:Uncharacterized protein n=1 Tax=Streptosporangium longisporum TaxID=46187 RepID=A0ABN3Y5B6_9ACTN
MSFDFGTPHAVCSHCGHNLERRSGLDRIVYLDWLLDPKLDRAACETSPTERHAPRGETPMSVRQEGSKLL